MKFFLIDNIHRSRRFASRRGDWLLGVLGIAVILGSWSFLNALNIIDAFFLPSPWQVLTTLVQLCATGFLWDVWASIYRVMLAFTLSAILAVPFGIAMGLSRRFEALVGPQVDFVRYLPVPALVPLTILWFGIGELSKIALLFIGTFFQLVLLVLDDVRALPGEYLDAGMTLGAPKRHLLTRILLPSIAPAVYDDLRITLGWCWTYLLIGELVAADEGIGFVIQQAQRFAQPTIVFAGIITIGLIGMASDLWLKAARPVFFPHLGKGKE